MSAPPLQPPAASIEERNREFAKELRQIEKRDWWVWGYSIFVILLLTFAVISFILPTLNEKGDTPFKVKASDAIFGLVALVILFNIYVVYQQTLIKRLRRQLAEKQGHSDLLRTLAMIDPLTGLYNRRFAEQRLAAEVARSERKGHPLTVLTLDLNDFKQVNDTHGHTAGDLVLQEFAARLNKVIRGADLAVRLGGDEFLVLLPECTQQQLELVLGRLGSLDVDWHGQKIPVTFSAGWKQYEMGERPEEMLERADRVLYDRKRASKKAQAPQTDIQENSRENSPLAPEAPPLHVLVDFTCPHCGKKNSFAILQTSGERNASRREVPCAHCKETWEPLIPGPVLAGPFPK
jgi:diguanylate cyclase (GGDEF)-like protein